MLALLVAAAAGVVAGAVTGILHTVFEIPAILAGILTQISLWSINLRIMGGKSNLPLLKVKTLISGLAASFGMTQAPGIDDRWNCAGCGGYSVSLLVLRNRDRKCDACNR